ncbi:hypothetical protein CNMCM5623_009524 [Aspergillus felis]|uniref:Heterokaryon incompatibility domain-containing protein n=1 Tax=Aspergillus felis TaxID=1287682 RepID=A0A8H6Q3R1_9EURO|nr:hypothetical protein CNMCM5623_009524 [Aspergillus felis]
MELCDLCKELDLSLLLPNLEDAHRREKAQWSRPKFARVDYVLRNATTCVFCLLISRVLVYVFYKESEDEDGEETSDKGISDKSCTDSDDEFNGDSDDEILGRLVKALVHDSDLLKGENQLRDSAPKFILSLNLSEKPTIRGGTAYQINLSVGGRHDIIQLPSLIPLQDDPPYGSGNARRVDLEQVDYCRLREWIRICEDHHQGCKPPTTWTQPRANPSEANGAHPFKVIDVIEYRVITAPQKCRYAALSYVWGPVEMQLQVKKANLAAVSAKFGLRVMETQLPETIKDAMQLVQGIGERYLWVDNMCIVQDDEISKSYWIHEMAAVYAGSLVTIVAAAGHDSNAGLPGLTVLNSHTSIVEYSVYNSRGWTFQERMLSCRNLVFLPNEVFFECRQAMFIEEVVCEDRAFSYKEHDQLYDLGVISPFKLLTPESGSDNYNELVQMYSSRCFSYESDVLNAFAGMLHVLNLEIGSPFICGHPIEGFARSLLWISDMDEIKGGARRKSFPSWAWSGWTGKKDISKIQWSTESANSDRSEISDMIEEEDARSFIWWRAEVLGDDRSSSCYQISPPTHSLQDFLQAYLHGQQMPTFNQPDYSYLPHLPRHLDTLQQVRLRFWTIVAPFKLSQKSLPRRIDLACLDAISDSESDYSETSSVGFAPDRFLSIWGRNDIACGKVIDCCADGLLTGDSAVYNLVVLGFSHDSISAMIVKWEAGVAERIGLARLLRGALNAALEPGMKWKEIVLG